MIDYNLQKNEPSEEEILRIANTNGYKLFAKKMEMDDILFGELDSSFLPFDPYQYMANKKFKHVIEGMLDYFIEEESYEICAFLRDYSYTTYSSNFSQYNKEHGNVEGNYIDPSTGKMGN